jgi:single-stranded DNA-binding protein
MAVISYEGRVIGQPEIKFTQTQKPYLKFRTVENSRRKIGDEWKDVGAAWRDVTVFGRDAESLAEVLNDKDVVLVQGRLDARDWENKDGVKQTSDQAGACPSSIYSGAAAAWSACNEYGLAEGWRPSKRSVGDAAAAR